MAINKRGPAAAKGSTSTRGRRGRPANRGPSVSRLPSTRINRGQHRRNLVNDDDEQAGRDDARAARRAEALEEEVRLREEEEQAAQEEGEEEEDAELAVILARVEQLKAQKADRIARQGTPRALTVLGGPSSQTTLGSMAWQGEESLVSVELSDRYPTIDESHFKAIKENKFKPINVVKLTTDFIMDRSKVKVISVGSDVALEAREEDALSGELKGLPHLIRCFLIYMSILLHFTHESLEKPLRIGMLAYVEQLWIFSGTYTFDSIKIYHMAFHTLRIRRGIDDGALWERIDSNLERRTMRLKQQSAEFTATSTAKRFNPGPYSGTSQASSSAFTPGQFNQPYPNGSSTCHRWNSGTDCYQATCKFRHVCAICNGNHRARECRVPGKVPEGRSTTADPRPPTVAPSGPRR